MSTSPLADRPPLSKYGRGRADPLKLQMADPRQLARAPRSRFAAVKVHRTLRTLANLLAADRAHKTASPSALAVPSAVMVQLAPSARMTQQAAQRVAARASRLANPAMAHSTGVAGNGTLVLLYEPSQFRSMRSTGRLPTRESGYFRGRCGRPLERYGVHRHVGRSYMRRGWCRHASRRCRLRCACRFIW